MLLMCCVVHVECRIVVQKNCVCRCGESLSMFVVMKVTSGEYPKRDPPSIGSGHQVAGTSVNATLGWKFCEMRVVGCLGSCVCVFKC